MLWEEDVKMKEFKEVPESCLEVLEEVGRFRDEFGRTVIQTKWRRVENEVDLGSVKNPKNNILQFRYHVPSSQSNLGNIFKGFFKG